MLNDRNATLAQTSNDSSKQGALADGGKGGEVYQQLRKLGGVAHQLRAASRAADHFLAQDASDDRSTGSWLISSAFGVAQELAADLDSLAKTLKDRPADAALAQPLRQLRTRAHQLHAATKAADHFLDQDSSEDKSTGSWLIAYSLGLADKLANEMDDVATGTKRPAGEGAQGFSDVNIARRAAPAGGLRDIAA